MTQTIVNGGTRTSQAIYVGAPNEVTADTSNKELRLHDGSTPGGVRIPNIESNDRKYQERSDELDGLKGFEPNAIGALFRVGAGRYTLRSLKVGAGLELANGTGHDGDPTFRLADIISGDREFQGDIIVRGVMQIDGGLNADIAGDSTGTHTGPQIGAIDARGKTVQFDNNQIPKAAVAGLSESLAQVVLPAGMITMWAGTIESIPVHWKLCDGSNGTPDLRSKFILGATNQDSMHTTAGAATHTHVATAAQAGDHSHAVDVVNTTLTVEQIPGHAHGNGLGDNSSTIWVYGNIAANPPTPESVDNNAGTGTRQGLTSTVGGGQPHSHGATSQGAGVHTHGLTVDPQNHMPPYYVLAYIMKIN